MTEDELKAIEEHIESPSDWADVGGYLPKLIAEVRRLQVQVKSLKEEYLRPLTVRTVWLE
jgi:hypothetical protein